MGPENKAAMPSTQENVNPKTTEQIKNVDISSAENVDNLTAETETNTENAEADLSPEQVEAVKKHEENLAELETLKTELKKTEEEIKSLSTMKIFEILKNPEKKAKLVEKLKKLVYYGAAIGALLGAAGAAAYGIENGALTSNPDALDHVTKYLDNAPMKIEDVMTIITVALGLIGGTMLAVGSVVFDTKEKIKKVFSSKKKTPGNINNGLGGNLSTAA